MRIKNAHIILIFWDDERETDLKKVGVRVPNVSGYDPAAASCEQSNEEYGTEILLTR